MNVSMTMRKLTYALIAVGAIASASADPTAMKTRTKGPMAKPHAVYVMPEDIKWMKAPPDLPAGAEVGVLFGDPTKAVPFAMRLKAPDGYKIAPHWHSKDEQLTIISGTLRLYAGDTMTGESHELTSGSFHFLPAKAHHAAEARGDTIVQVNGVGPFDIHYLNSDDNPNPTPRSARR